MNWSLCIFAHNEARLLPRCIGALDAAAAGGDFRAHIIVNGSTDDTEQVANVLAAADTRLKVHNLAMADKANAWNHYVHRLAGAAQTHFFIDGDVTPSAASLKHMSQKLNASPQAHGVAALPAAGRNQRDMATKLVSNGFLAGNLYALTGNAINKFREKSLYLPYGAKGEDGLIAYLLLTDFKGGENDHHWDRLTVAEDATFEFDSLNVNPRDMMIYHRRLKRYSERHFQKKILYRSLKRHGLRAMPENIYDIYTQSALRRVKLRRNPVYYWYDRATLNTLKRKSPPARSKEARA